MGKLKFKKNPTIKKENYKNVKEFNFDEKTDVVPNTKEKLMCIMFSEERGCHFIYRKFNINSEFDYFRFRRGMYIIESQGIHITANGSRIAFYLEGISTPIKLSNIQKKTVTVAYKDLEGKVKYSTIQKIKGLKFDAKILDTFANRRFAEIFTKKPMDNFQILIVMFQIISMVMIGIAYGLIWYFK